MMADRYFFASCQTLLIAILCLIALVVKVIDKKQVQICSVVLMLGLILCGVVRHNYISQIDFDKSEIKNREILTEYGDIPWVYYGGEDWKMAGHLMDFLIPEEYIVLSVNTDYSQNEKVNEMTEFIMYVKDYYYDPKGAFEEMEKALGCTLEREFLFEREYSKVFYVRKITQ